MDSFAPLASRSAFLSTHKTLTSPRTTTHLGFGPSFEGDLPSILLSAADATGQVAEEAAKSGNGE